MTKEQIFRLNTFDRALVTAKRLGNHKFAEYCEKMISYIENMNEGDALPDSPY